MFGRLARCSSRGDDKTLDPGAELVACLCPASAVRSASSGCLGQFVGGSLSPAALPANGCGKNLQGSFELRKRRSRCQAFPCLRPTGSADRRAELYSEFHGGQALPVWQLSDIRRLAWEIEVLAPACDAGDIRVDNSEYPWLDAGGLVQVPCDYKFSRINDESRTFVLVVKLLRAAARTYAR